MGLTSDATRKVMRANRSKDTGPELRLRRALHARGLRYRANHRIVVDGFACRPDVVFPRRRVAVFVDGCFWHACREHWRLPKSNVDFWQAKVDANLLRDQRTDYALEEAGWAVVRVWEHDLADELGVDEAADRVADVVSWEPGRGVPDEWDGNGRPDGWSYWERQWCCRWHPDSLEAERRAPDEEVQNPRRMFEVIDDTWICDHVTGHLMTCDACQVAWACNEDAVEEDCWSCGATGNQSARRRRAEVFVRAWSNPASGWTSVGYMVDEVNEWSRGIEVVGVRVVTPEPE